MSLGKVIWFFVAACVLIGSVNAGVVGSVNSLDVAMDGDLLASGGFVTEDGSYAKLIRLKNGEIDRTFRPLQITPATANVNAVRELHNGDLAITLSAWMVNGQHRKLWRLSADGVPASPSEFVSPFGTTDGAGGLQIDAAGGIIANGTFQTFFEPMRIGALRVFPDGRLDPEYRRAGAIGPDGRVWAVQTVSATPRFVTMNSDGSDVRTNLNVAPTSITHRYFFRPDGRVIVTGGTYTHTNSQRFIGIAQLLPNGAIDTSFAANGQVSSILAVAFQPDGKVLVGGTFTAAFGKPINRILRLTQTGALDETFSAANGADGSVAAIAITPDKKAWFGGAFTNIGANPSRGLASVQLSYEGAPEQVGFRWTRMPLEENASSVRVELVRQGIGANAISGTIHVEGAGGPQDVPFEFAADDFKRKVIHIPLAIDNNDGDGDRAATLSLVNISGGSAIANADVCEVTVRDDESGLTADYYELAPGYTFTFRLQNMVGRHVTKVRDSVIRFNWDDARPVPGLSTNYYAIVWRGQFVPDQTGQHNFRSRSDDGVRIWVDGRLIQDDWMEQPPTVLKDALPISLVAGTPVDFEVHYVNDLLQGSLEISLSQYPLQRRHFRQARANQGVPPSFGLLPTNRYIALNGSVAQVNLMSDARGTPSLGVQWYYGEEAINNATNFTFRIAVAPESVGAYTVVATNAWGSITNVINVELGYKPEMAATNFTLLKKIGEPFEAAFAATRADEPFAYRWTHAGTNWAATPTGAFNIPQLSAQDSGLYQVAVTNRFGASATSSFYLYVLDREPGSASLQLTSGAEGKLEIMTDPALGYRLFSSLDLVAWTPRTNLATNGMLSISWTNIATNAVEFFRLQLAPY